MKQEGSFLHTQQLTTEPYPELEFSPHAHTNTVYFFKIHSDTILINTWVSQVLY